MTKWLNGSDSDFNKAIPGSNPVTSWRGGSMYVVPGSAPDCHAAVPGLSPEPFSDQGQPCPYLGWSLVLLWYCTPVTI